MTTKYRDKRGVVVCNNDFRKYLINNKYKINKYKYKTLYITEKNKILF